jgi:hypothetical protein
MNKIKFILIVIGVIVAASVLCSLSVQGEHAQANTTLAMMTNLKLADTTKSLAGTIDHMAWGYVIGYVVMAVVIVALVIILARSFSGKGGQSGNVIVEGSSAPALHSGNGYPRYVVLGAAGQQYVMGLPRAQQEYTLAELEVIVSLLRSNLGYKPGMLLEANNKRSRSIKW